VLDAREISVHFGGVRAVESVSLSVGEREILGIIGPNGSGKTTFLNALTGVVSATGRLTMDGKPLALGRPGQSRAAGILRVFQNPQTFTALGCLENVLLSTPDRRFCGIGGAWLLRPLLVQHERRRWRDAMDALERVGLVDVAEVSASELTYGQQRLLELARAIAGEPRILLLDEPSAGLNEVETANLARLCLGLRDDGLALAVVDHKVDFIDSLCDRVAVLELGRLIALGTPTDVWADETVVDAYLGVAPDA
jgi:ABC-type branched-subunit amino acid transport system ATPase component